ncbi:MAG: hypothetical protein HY814_11715, partial [Candidatus Riflebacteria bacterium]|nr:hypothetical protein [Candidatus Riflebacteria bacterium]
WYQRFQEGTVASNDTFLAIEDVPETLASPVAKDFDAEVSAKARVLVLDVSSGTDPREKVGSLEVEGQARVPLGRKHSITRRVTLRRDFKSIYLAGQNPLSDYTLYVKDVRGMLAASPGSVQPDEPALIVKNRRDANSALRDSGCLYLGQGPHPPDKQPIMLLSPGRRGLLDQEIKYLQGVKLALSPTNPQRYELGSWDAERSFFQDDHVPVEKARAIIEDMLHTMTGPGGQPFSPAQIEAVTARVRGAKMKHEYLRGDPRASGLDLYINDPGQAVEGDIFYSYWFRRVFDFQFTGGSPPTQPATQAAVLASAVSFLNGDPNGSDRVMQPLAHATGLPGLDSREERIKTACSAMAFTHPKFYARVFTTHAVQPKPEAAFKARYVRRPAAGPPVLQADGIVGIVGDLTLDEDMVVSGQGIVLVLGKLVVKGSLTKSRPTDQLFLVSRGGSVSLPGGKKVHAHVQGLNLHYPDQACLLDVSDGGPMDLHGGLAVDRLESTKLRANKNLVEYDENLSKWIFHTSFSDRLLFWAARSDEEAALKETYDG